MNEKSTDEIEIDIREIAAALLGWLWLILLVALAAGASAFAVSRFAVTPTYESTTRIVVLNKPSVNDTLTYSDLQLGSQLTKDYPELIRSRYVIENVIGTFGLDMAYEDFIKKVDVETPTDTRIINITVTDPDPILAKNLVDEIRNVAAVRIKEVMDIEAVNVVDEGNVALEPSHPNVIMWTLLGFLAGAAVTVAVVMIRFLLDDTIQSSEDVEKYLGLSTLALIPVVLEEGEKNGGRRGRHKKTPAEEKVAPNEAKPPQDLIIDDLTDTSAAEENL